VPGQPFGDALGGEIVLAAGEAVREQGIGGRLAQRFVERRREKLALGIGKGETAAAHSPAFSVALAPSVFALYLSKAAQDRSRQIMTQMLLACDAGTSRWSPTRKLRKLVAGRHAECPWSVT